MKDYTLHTTYQIDLTREHFDTLEDAIKEAKELFEDESNTEVIVDKVVTLEDKHGNTSVHERVRTFSLERYEDGGVEEFNY